MTVTNYECPDGTPFPVEWPDPEMENSAWIWDQLHNPLPATPLAQDLFDPKRIGMLRGGVTTGRPMPVGERLFFHGYVYSRPVLHSDEEQSTFRLVAERDAELRLGRLTELFESEYRPEAEALTRSLHTWAASDDSLADLMSRFDEVEAIAARHGELHTLSMSLTNIGWGDFQRFCTAEFGDEADQLALDTTAGLPNKSLDSANALWDLSRQIAARPAVADLLRSTVSSEFMPAIDSVSGGEDCRLLIEAFLDEWGLRNESFSEIAFPTWKEDPTFVITTLRKYLDNAEGRSPAQMHSNVAETRERRTEEAKTRLGSAEKVAKFLELLRIAQQRTVMIEDHNYYIDQRGHASLRFPCLAIGDRLVEQGSIDDRSDVFYLHRRELFEAAEDADARYQSIIEQRRADRDSWMKVLPPATIGKGKVVMSPIRAAFFGDVDLEPAEDGTVNGLAASKGTARGIARLILTLDDADKLGPGEILVTYATAPSWTPLFAVASAVVTDIGGPLAHCAVVAREYGIPAVVGTRTATADIKDGQMVEVDGTAGVVRILD